jgi:hypothetical protein
MRSERGSQGPPTLTIRCPRAGPDVLLWLRRVQFAARLPFATLTGVANWRTGVIRLFAGVRR